MWAIVALGPEQLEGLGINPDRVWSFVEQSFMVEVTIPGRKAKHKDQGI